MSLKEACFIRNSEEKFQQSRYGSKMFCFISLIFVINNTTYFTFKEHNFLVPKVISLNVEQNARWI